MSELLALAEKTVRMAQELGADEVVASVSHGTHATLVRRDGKVEQATEATSHGLSVSLMWRGRWSAHSTSDLRPEALRPFLERALVSTRLLEPDPERALPDPNLCGRGASEAELDQDDPEQVARTPEDRAAQALALEQAVASVRDPRVISSSTHTADGRSRTIRVTSDGFADEHVSAGFSVGTEVTIDEGNGRRPEGYVGYGTRHLSDLPDLALVAEEGMSRALERVGAGPVESGRYTMVLQNRAAGRILGMLSGPISGGALFEKRSCLEGRLGTRIGSDLLTILDDPLRPRGMASRPWDGDGLVARPFPVVSEGTLASYYLSVYYGRKLGMSPTSGGRSNWVVPAGATSWQSQVAGVPTAVLVHGFLGGNMNPITGDFSFGVRGSLLERGEVARPIAEMNVSGNVLELFHRLVGLGDDLWTWSSTYAPTMIFDGVDFSGT